jgi:hypothetical protein
MFPQGLTLKKYCGVMEFLIAKELFTYCKYVLFVRPIPKVLTKISFGIGMVNTKKYRPIPTGKYRFGIQLWKNSLLSNIII